MGLEGSTIYLRIERPSQENDDKRKRVVFKTTIDLNENPTLPNVYSITKKEIGASSTLYLRRVSESVLARYVDNRDKAWGDLISSLDENVDNPAF